MTKRMSVAAGALTAAIPVLIMVGLLIMHWAKQPRTHVARWSRSDIITRTEGRASSPTPFVLVEFADYRCPACRRVNPDVERLLARGGNRLSLIRLELPLVRPVRTWDACVVAEALDLQGRRSVFDAAAYDYGADLTPAGLRAILARMGQVSPRPTLSDGTRLPPCAPVDMRRFNVDQAGRALRTVKLDIAQAQRLHVAAIPTFYLCGPDGVCYSIRSLKDVAAIMELPPLQDEG